MTLHHEKANPWRPQWRLSTLLTIMLLMALMCAWLVELQRANRLALELERIQNERLNEDLRVASLQRMFAREFLRLRSTYPEVTEYRPISDNAPR